MVLDPHIGKDPLSSYGPPMAALLKDTPLDDLHND